MNKTDNKWIDLGYELFNTIFPENYFKDKKLRDDLEKQHCENFIKNLIDSVKGSQPVLTDEDKKFIEELKESLLLLAI